MTRKRRHARGFTMIELLVTGACASMFMALAAPGIFQFRERARMNTCKNNMKQMGLALHNYHDTFNTFPPGWIAKNNKAGSVRLFGWQSMILPFIEEMPLFNKLDFNKKFPKPDKLTKRSIPLFLCPSDTMGETNLVRGGYGTSSYSGNHGNQRLPGSADTPKKANGIFFLNSRVRIRDIKDGTSNTFMLGERCVTSASGIWIGLRTNQNENDQVTDTSDSSRLNAVITSFSSRHGGGAQFLFCDARVKFIDDSISSKDGAGEKMGIYQRLGQRNDRLPVKF